MVYAKYISTKPEKSPQETKPKKRAITFQNEATATEKKTSASLFHAHHMCGEPQVRRILEAVRHRPWTAPTLVAKLLN